MRRKAFYLILFLSLLLCLSAAASETPMIVGEWAAHEKSAGSSLDFVVNIKEYDLYGQFSGTFTIAATFGPYMLSGEGRVSGRIGEVFSLKYTRWESNHPYAYRDSNEIDFTNIMYFDYYADTWDVGFAILEFQDGMLDKSGFASQQSDSFHQRISGIWYSGEAGIGLSLGCTPTGEIYGEYYYMLGNDLEYVTYIRDGDGNVDFDTGIMSIGAHTEAVFFDYDTLNEWGITDYFFIHAKLSDSGNQLLISRKRDDLIAGRYDLIMDFLYK